MDIQAVGNHGRSEIRRRSHGCTWVRSQSTLLLRLAHILTRFLEEPTHLRLELGKGVLGTYIDPVPELVTGQVKEWAETAGVEAIQIPGYWTHKRGEDIAMGAKPKPGEKVMYHMSIARPQSASFRLSTGFVLQMRW